MHDFSAGSFGGGSCCQARGTRARTGAVPGQARRELRVEYDLFARASDFFRLVRDAEAFRRYLFQLLSARVTDLMEVIDEVAFRRLDERLAALLVADGNTVLASHQALADQLGTTREMISRLLGQFEDKRWVLLKRERIEVLDRAPLQRLASRAAEPSN